MKSSLLSSIKKNIVSSPGRVAVIDSNGISHSYSEVWSRTARLQNLFPIDEPRVVGIYLDYDTSLIEAVLAVVRSGAVAVTIEPSRDINDAKALFLDRGVEFVITTPRYSRMLAGFLQIHPSDTALDRVRESVDEDIDERTHAYVAGGRKLSHGSISALSSGMIEKAKLTESETVLLTSEVGSSGFIRELFGTFMAGATLVVLPSNGRYDGRKTLEFAEAEGVTLIPTPVWLRNEISSRRLSISRTIRLYVDPSDCVTDHAKDSNTEDFSKAFGQPDVV